MISTVAPDWDTNITMERFDRRDDAKCNPSYADDHCTFIPECSSAMAIGKDAH
jgi:hypothetical protein